MHKNKQSLAWDNKTLHVNLSDTFLSAHDNEETHGKNTLQIVPRNLPNSNFSINSKMKLADSNYECDLKRERLWSWRLSDFMELGNVNWKNQTKKVY